MDKLEDIALYYRGNSEDRRLNLQNLELQVTLRLLRRYLDRYLDRHTSGDGRLPRILELGAGTGRYTLELARWGFEVVAVDMVEELTELSRRRLADAGLGARVAHLTADAREISKFTEGSFEAVLAMGPFYHLVLESDRKLLMRDVAERLKPGGQAISSHLSRMGLLGYMLTRYPAWGLEDPAQVESIMTQGYLPDHPRNGAFRGYFTTVAEIEALARDAGLAAPCIHSQDPGIGSADELFNRLPEDVQAAWSEVLARYSDDPLALGSGRSLLSVAGK